MSITISGRSLQRVLGCDACASRRLPADAVCKLFLPLVWVHPILTFGSTFWKTQLSQGARATLAGRAIGTAHGQVGRHCQARYFGEQPSQCLSSLIELPQLRLGRQE